MLYATVYFSYNFIFTFYVIIQKTIQLRQSNSNEIIEDKTFASIVGCMRYTNYTQRERDRNDFAGFNLSIYLGNFQLLLSSLMGFS